MKSKPHTSLPKTTESIDPAKLSLYVGGPIETFQSSTFEGVDKPLKLIADVNGIQLFQTLDGKFVLDFPNSISISLGNTEEYSLQRSRYFVEPELAIRTLIAAAIPNELKHLLPNLTFPKLSAATDLTR